MRKRHEIISCDKVKIILNAIEKPESLITYVKTIQWYKDNPQWIKRILSGEYRNFQRGVNVI